MANVSMPLADVLTRSATTNSTAIDALSCVVPAPADPLQTPLSRPPTLLTPVPTRSDQPYGLCFLFCFCKNK
jgi:hypothetical protein